MNLTPHLSPKAQQHLRNLSISPFAQRDIEAAIKPRRISAAYLALGDSAASLVDSLYMKRSAWFRDQPAHTSCALRVNQIEPVMVLARREDGWEIRSPSEHEMPADYDVQRVIEETKAEYL